MRFRCFALHSLFLLTTVASGSAQSTDSVETNASQVAAESAMRTSIAQARTRFVRAWQGTSGRQMEKAFTLNAQIRTPNGSVFVGRSGHRKFAQYTKALEATNTNFDAQSVSPTAEGRVSEWGSYTWLSRGNQFRGRYAITWQLVEGTWQIDDLRMSV